MATVATASTHKTEQSWAYGLALALLRPARHGRDVLEAALPLITASSGCLYAFGRTLEPNGRAGEVIACAAAGGDVNRNAWDRIQQSGFPALVQQSESALVSRDEQWAGVPLIDRGDRLGLIVLQALPGARFSVQTLADLLSASGLIAAALASAKSREHDEEEVARLVQMQRDLTAMTAHDLRAPLQNIQMSFRALERLIDADLADTRVASLIDEGARATLQLSRMIKSLLDVERLESGEMVLFPRPVELATVLEQAFEILVPMAAASNQALIADLPPFLARALIDPAVIQRVIINLVENAVKYTPAGGAIRVVVKPAGEWARISVCDTGPGIPRHLRNAIFERYYRVREGRSREGVGLGLTFCRLAVEAHGGHIEVDSDHTGARFTFTIPLEVEGAAETGSLETVTSDLS